MSWFRQFRTCDDGVLLFFSSRRRHTRSVSAFLLNRSADLPRVARLMIHTPTAISIFVCLSMVQLMAVVISMRCTLCGHFLQVALSLILVVGYAIAASYIACQIERKRVV